MRPAYPFEAVGASIALDSGDISVGGTDPRPGRGRRHGGHLKRAPLR
jgi:hypothetical protein